jgi:hypothetical protein
MALADDIANDYQIIDGVEDVTVTPRTPAAAAQPNVKALRRAISRSEVFFGGQVGISPNDTVFHLWVSTLGGIVPNPGDTITQAGGQAWEILSQQLQTLSTRYRCVCRKQV